MKHIVKPNPGLGGGVFKPIFRTLVSNPACLAGLSLDANLQCPFHISFHNICLTFYFVDWQRAKDPSSELLSVGYPRQFRSMLRIDWVMGNRGKPYDTINQSNLRGKTPSFGAPLTMASTIDQNHGRRQPWPLPTPVALGCWVQSLVCVDGVMGIATYNRIY